MSEINALIYPCLFLMFITIIVWAKLLFDRITEMKARKIHPQNLGSSSQAATVLRNLRSSDNFKNLFELPVMFYALCILIILTKMNSPILEALAWIFVIGRGIHSAIHCSYNKTMHRFVAFILSSLSLFAMAGLFALKLFNVL